MTLLLIDDLRNFRVAPEGELVIARTSQDALDYLNAHEDDHFSEIWLDHDLGETDTIMRVVDYLNERAFFDNHVDVDVIYIQSSNPVGVKQMLAGFERYGYRAQRVDANKIFVV